MQHNAPPQSLAELHSRAKSLQHMTLGELAGQIDMPLPQALTHHKGLIGQCVEAFLGADAGNESSPDFTALGVELKTLPVNPKGNPKESTYVCTVPLENLQGLTWENSHVRAKLSHVLWVPILVIPEQPLAERRIQEPIFWQPSPKQEEILQTDFNELIDLIALGQLEQITASLGTHLHIRPKAANARCLTRYGAKQTLPRGFYLRAAMTQGIINPPFRTR